MEEETAKPQTGAWGNLTGYPKKISFELNNPVLVTFGADFQEPTEMPNQDGSGVYFIFDVLDGNGDKAAITTSAWTLLKSLKSHEPLAGKALIITKKNVKGKNMYYVTLPENYGAPEVSQEKAETEEDVGIAEDSTV